MDKTNQYQSPDKWKNIMETTLNNYIHMEKRLKYQQKISNSILTYYSIALIIYTISSKYFPDRINTYLLEYVGLVLSIILLGFSLINGSANYEQRISKVTKAINRIRVLKRELGERSLEDIKKDYYAITEVTELRDDIDFFRTVKSLCKEHGMLWYYIEKKSFSRKPEEERIRNYLSEINPIICQLKIWIRYLMDILLFILPVIVFIICYIC